MKKTKTVAFTNLIGAILFIILGIWAWIQTCSFQEVKGSFVQPSTFSRIMIVGMLIFAVVLLIQSIFVLMTMKEGDMLAKPAESINPVEDKGVLAAYGVILLCILFALLFKTVGYVICGAAISIIIMYVIGKRNWVQMIVVSVLVPLGMWFIFYKILTVNIPLGPLTFLRDIVDKF
jgi:hypothetical protein